MVGTIVYANSSSSLEIIQPRPVIYIQGGFVRWIGYNDSRELIANVTYSGNITQPVR